jgi:hypothetical protein
MKNAIVVTTLPKAMNLTGAGRTYKIDRHCICKQETA